MVDEFDGKRRGEVAEARVNSGEVASVVDGGASWCSSREDEASDRCGRHRRGQWGRRHW